MGLSPILAVPRRPRDCQEVGYLQPACVLSIAMFLTVWSWVMSLSLRTVARYFREGCFGGVLAFGLKGGVVGACSMISNRVLRVLPLLPAIFPCNALQPVVHTWLP